MRRLIAALAVLVSVALPGRAPATTSPFQQALYDYGNQGVGWTGGDGAYSVPLGDGRTAWLFSDTFLGTVNEDGSRPAGTPLVRNSIVVEDGAGFSTRAGSDGLLPSGTLVPTADRVSWYWMGDGTVEAGVLRAFLFRFVPVPGPLLFQQISVELAEFSLPGVTLASVTPMPQAFTPAAGGAMVSWGSAILEQPDHTYVYGVEDLRFDKRLYVARTPPGDLRGAWEYWTGSGWSPLAAAAVPVLGGVANEMSVSAIGGRFVAVAQENSAGVNVYAYDAPNPWGPFDNKRLLLSTAADVHDNLFTYNAKAHPQRSAPGTLLVGYNVNSFAFSDLFQDVNNYRPRFVVVPL